MAATKISDVIVPEVFNPYVVNRTMELSTLFTSGIVQNDSVFDTLASSSSYTVNMPYWNDITGEDEVLSDSRALTPTNIGSGKDVAVILRRGRAWGANDLAGALAGSDPMAAIGDLVATYWMRRMQACLISTLTGVFGAANMTTHVVDISTKEGDAAKFNSADFINACYALGDNEQSITGVAMHSATMAHLVKQNLIEYVQVAGQPIRIPTYLGKRVVVDDGCPVSSGVYTTYLFGENAIAMGNGNPVDFVPTETDRDSLASTDILINRKTFILHPRGVAFTSASVDEEESSPTNTDLANGTNWNRVYDVKKVKVVAFKHKL